jgi:hypothetical protein
MLLFPEKKKKANNTIGIKAKENISCYHSIALPKELVATHWLLFNQELIIQI